MRRHQRRLFFTLLFAAVGGAATGCSNDDGLPRVPVAGTVTLDGQPLADGTIQFALDGASPSGAVVGGGSQVKDGKFAITRELGLVPGKYRVSVNSAGKRIRVKSDPDLPGKGGSFSPEMIPSKYNSETGLRAEIKEGGTSDLKYELQSK
jgi:hypothetical protein